MDGPEKVTGQARYGDDLALYGLLHARLVLGLHARARIKSVGTSQALTVPGVIAVVTADDLAAVLKSPPTSRCAEMLARGETRFCGRPGAAVLAESEAAAEDALALVEIEYEELLAVLDPLDALRRRCPGRLAGRGTRRKETDDACPIPSLQSPNVADHVTVRPWRRRRWLRRGRRRGRALLPEPRSSTRATWSRTRPRRCSTRSGT